MMGAWTKHLRTSEEKERFESRLQGSKDVFERLTQLINEEEAQITSAELSLDVYKMPGWSALMGDQRGERRMARKIKRLINLDQQKE